MVKISEVQAQARADIFSQHQRPSANPIATEITPKPVPLLPSQGWAEPKKRCTFPAC